MTTTELRERVGSSEAARSVGRRVGAVFALVGLGLVAWIFAGARPSLQEAFQALMGAVALTAAVVVVGGWAGARIAPAPRQALWVGPVSALVCLAVAAAGLGLTGLLGEAIAGQGRGWLRGLSDHLWLPVAVALAYGGLPAIVLGGAAGGCIALRTRHLRGSGRGQAALWQSSSRGADCPGPSARLPGWRDRPTKE